MPLYDYQCGACETVFEAEHAMSERPKLRCPQCRSTRTAKVFNAASVQFKTGGFYVTDSRPKATDSSKDGGDGKAETKAETKPESKPEAKTEPSKPSKSEPVAAG